MSIVEILAKLSKKQKSEDNSEYNVYWETHCKFCGNLFEKCTCDCKRYKRPDNKKTLEDIVEESFENTEQEEMIES